MNYAIIRIGNKQHRVRDGETLVVERVRTGEGRTFTPEVLLGSAKVTARVVAHERGPKIRIGKYRKRTGYKRHNGYRSAISRVTISLGAAKAAPAEQEPPKAQPPPVPAAEAAKPEPAAPPGLPAGYDQLTVVAIGIAAKTWSLPQLEAALAYEQEHAKRKGALAALESALARENE